MFPYYEGSSQIIAVNVVADTRTLCVIMRNGDIAILPLDDPSEGPRLLDPIGTVDPVPVLTASFAPDSSLLALVASSEEPTLLLMDTSFQVITSSKIITAAYGAEKPVNVGWGSKTTQFHGSLGKVAAQAPAVPEPSTVTPDDDFQPRISWRGDGQHFAVSVVEDRKRILRMYDRRGILQSTGETVAGLEAGLAWRPNGGLIASTQRFGNVPNLDPQAQSQWALGKGRQGRHDVVFFERNGLKHGEFGLREVMTNDGGGLKWGYKVRELGWNADSTVLSVWIERHDGDVGEQF